MKTYEQIKNRKIQRRNANFVKQLRNKPTRAELIVKNWFIENGIKHIFQKGFIKPFHRIVDFYIPKKKIIIEIDGSIHNNLKEKDNYKDKSFLINRGFVTIRILNEEVYNGKFKNKLWMLK